MKKLPRLHFTVSDIQPAPERYSKTYKPLSCLWPRIFTELTIDSPSFPLCSTRGYLQNFCLNVDQPTKEGGMYVFRDVYMVEIREPNRQCLPWKKNILEYFEVYKGYAWSRIRPSLIMLLCKINSWEENDAWWSIVLSCSYGSGEFVNGWLVSACEHCILMIDWCKCLLPCKIIRGLCFEADY